jgi:hypothetical protein
MPDGKTLIFAAKTNPTVPYDLYTVATDGTGLQRLTSNGASEPAPSANGSVVYVHDGDLYLCGVGDRTHRLTQRGGPCPTARATVARSCSCTTGRCTRSTPQDAPCVD